MFDKERKERYRKREKTIKKRQLIKKTKSTHKSKTKRKNGNENTHLYAFLQVDLRFAFTLFYT